MKLVKTKTFEENYVSLPPDIRKKADKQLRFLASDIRHPSIRAKKIKGAKDIWEGRISKFHRFTFEIKKDEIWLRHFGPHNKTLKFP